MNAAITQAVDQPVGKAAHGTQGLIELVSERGEDAGGEYGDQHGGGDGEAFHEENPRLGGRILPRFASPHRGQPGHSAGVVSFLAGPDGAWTTGQVIDVSGGTKL